MQLQLYCREILVYEFELALSDTADIEQEGDVLFDNKLGLKTMVAALAERAWSDFELRILAPMSVQQSLSAPSSPFQKLEVTEIGFSRAGNCSKLTMAAKIGEALISDLGLLVSRSGERQDGQFSSISIALPFDTK